MTDEQAPETQDVEQAETATPADANTSEAQRDAEPKPTETVEFWRAKAREQEKRAKANADAATKLKEIEDRDLSELEKAQRAAKEYGDELAALKARSLRNEVALAKGLPANLAARLQGNTEEELAADADELLALVNVKRTPAPDRGQGARETSAEADADAEYRKYFPTD